ncbi:MAG: imidazole glycerol phosphate synthase subunit HisH [Clostridiales Family XIII bacterium]|jgi:glutamine amidotransferase|nr:imidazole glycerol phosphate synthase subunit HisH [Clostridiales Family XIII bacterium]
MIAIVDYGAGNLFSVKNALDFLGFDSVITADRGVAEAADKLILPGVGAFPDAMGKLEAAGLAEVIKTEARRKPLLGICLGMQMLFEWGHEFAKTKGLGLIGGYVDKISAPGLKVPHMGWSDLHPSSPCALSEGVEEGDRAYFVHSYKAVMADPRNLSLYTDYGERIPGLVFEGQVYGCQFHPEKSGRVGLGILRNFCELG